MPGTPDLHYVRAGDVLLSEAAALRYSVLLEPFGVSADGDRDDADPASTHLVAVEDGKAVGYARLIAMPDGSARIRQVAVEPSRQRSGIGSSLVLELVGLARRRAIPLVWLEARVTAIAFYERLGFKARPGVFPSGRTGLPHVRMEQPLR
ncbi:MAG: GNAT family N-acetyltransferase [Coriobacteriia bacterium]